ncbi:hypothetical protein [Epilithonimonas sp. UC225_85]|uniref:hypothetical protein n=1 Tax=Epilithonimonas sp. UC225_85 TaxID=3350167 RepID=UPI0036D212E2
MIKKNKLYFIVCILSFIVSVNGQIKISNMPEGNAVIDNTAILEVQSSAKGVLLPRLTTAQRNLITTPPNGLIIYNTSIGCYEFYTTGGTKNTTANRWYSVCTGTVCAVPTITAGTFSTYCNATQQVLSVTATGTGLTYQWQRNGTAIPGATANTYTATQEGSYNVVINGQCGTTSSNLAVFNKPTYFPTPPTTQNVNVESQPETTFSAVSAGGGGGTVTYKWQISRNSGSTWTDITDGESSTDNYMIFSNSGTQNLTVKWPTTLLSPARQFRLAVTTSVACGTNPAYSTAATLNTSPSPAYLFNDIFCAGLPAGWVATGTTSQATGVPCGRILNPGDVAGSSGGGVNRTFATTPGQQYTFVARILNSGSAASSQHLNVYDNGTNTLLGQADNFGNNLTSVTFTATSTTTRFEILDYGATFESDGYVYMARAFSN